MSDHQGRTPLGDKEINQEETLEHAKAVYQNGQDINKFIDTKTGAVTGLCTLGIGGIFGLVTWYFQLDDANRDLFLKTIHPCSAAVWLLAVSALAGVGSLSSSLCSLIARPPHTSTLTILFPCLRKTTGKWSRFCKTCMDLFRRNEKNEKPWDEVRQFYKDRIVGGMTPEQVRTDYYDQILNVGVILRKKMVWHWLAVACLMLQLVAAGFSAFLICCDIASHSPHVGPCATICAAPVSSSDGTPLPLPPFREPSNPTNSATRR